MMFSLQISRVAIFSLLAGLLVISPNVGAQGVSPFGDATPMTDAATPEASVSSTWEIADVREIEVDGMPVALSPDGQWLAGLGPDEELCVWEIESLTPTCAEPGDYRPNVEALVWSPDSTAIAFTEDAARLVIDSDVHVFELASGTLTNLTDDAYAGALMLSPEEGSPAEVHVDLGATWSADSQSISFGRMFWTAEDRGEKQPEIVRIARTGGETEVVAELATGNPWGVVHPMVELADGTLVYAISTGDPGNPNEGIWVLAPGTEPEQVVPATIDSAFPYSKVVDARQTPNGLVISGYSMALGSQGMGLEPYAFVLDVNSGDLETLEPGLTPLRFGPDGESAIALAVVGNEGMLTIFSPDGEASALGIVARSRFEQSRGLDWATNNTVFLASGVSSGLLVTMSPDGA